MVENFSHKSSILFAANRFSLHFPFGSQLHKETTYFLSTIGDDGSRQVASDAASFVRVFCNLVFVLVMVENFSHKSSIVSLLSVNPFSFPFSTLLSFYKLFPFVLVTPDINVRYNGQM